MYFPMGKSKADEVKMRALAMMGRTKDCLSTGVDGRRAWRGNIGMTCLSPQLSRLMLRLDIVQSLR
jgi:hypothetical protein